MFDYPKMAIIITILLHIITYFELQRNRDHIFSEIVEFIIKRFIIKRTP